LSRSRSVTFVPEIAVITPRSIRQSWVVPACSTITSARTMFAPKNWFTIAFGRAKPPWASQKKAFTARSAVARNRNLRRFMPIVSSPLSAGHVMHT
jgi:hypothetical protein